MTDDLQQQVINTTFKGDKDAYERAWARTTKDTLQWSTIVEASSVEPILNRHALDLLAFHFGYVPSDQLSIPYLPVLSSLIQDYQNSFIDYESLISMSEQCLRKLRNQIVILHSEIAYPSSTYQQYALLPVEYKDKAKQRFYSLLGYEPKTETSIQCELAISSVLSSDATNLGNLLSGVDCQILTIIKYREILLTQGKSKADDSKIPINDIKISNNCFVKFDY